MSGAIIGIVGTSASLYGQYDAKKEADRRYEAQQAAFSDDVEASIMNGKWALEDNTRQLALDKEVTKAGFESYVEAAWNTFASQAEYNKALTSLQVLTERELTDIELEQMKENTSIELKTIADMAQLDAQYKLAVAATSNSEALTKAAIEAAAYAETANNALEFINQDINTMKESLNSIKEITDIETKEAVGQEILRIADTVNAGGSMARKLMNTYIKADIMANTKMKEQESAIDKALASATRTAKDTKTRIDSTMKQVHNKVISDTNRVISGVHRDLANTKISMEDKMASLVSSSKALQNQTNVQMNTMIKQSNIKLKELQDSMNTQVLKASRDYNTEVYQLQQNYDLAQYQTSRGLEQSIITQQETIGKHQADQNLLDLYNTTPQYAQEEGVGVSVDTTNEPYTASLLGYTDMDLFYADYATDGVVNRDKVYEDLNKIS